MKRESSPFDREIGNRIRQLRAERQISSQVLADRLGVTRGAVGNWELGKGIKRDNLQKIADEFDVSLDWLTNENAAPAKVAEKTRRSVPLVGYVGAGQAIHPMDDPYEAAPAPSDTRPSTVAVEVRGESMYPAYDDGTLLYYSKLLPPVEMVNKKCVVQLADGRIFVKVLRRGSSDRLWTLQSINSQYGDMVDQYVEWVAPIDWVKPRF